MRSAHATRRAAVHVSFPQQNLCFFFEKERRYVWNESTATVGRSTKDYSYNWSAFQTLFKMLLLTILKRAVSLHNNEAQNTLQLLGEALSTKERKVKHKKELKIPQ